MENPQAVAVTLHFCLLGVSWAHCFLLPFDVSGVREGSVSPWAQAHAHARLLGCNEAVSRAWVCWGQAGTGREGWGRRLWKNPSLSRALSGQGGSAQPTRALPPVLSDREGGPVTSLCLEEETEASGQSGRVARTASGGTSPGFSVAAMCRPFVQPLPPRVPSPIRRTPGLAPRAGQGSGRPGRGHSARPGGPRATIPTHTAAKAGVHLNTGPDLAL